MKRAHLEDHHAPLRLLPRWAPVALACVMMVALAVTPAGCGSDDPAGGVVVVTSENEPDGSATTEEAEEPDDADGVEDSDTPDELALTADDEGGTFAIQAGGTITVALEANPSTGHNWEMDDPDPEASLLEQAADPSFESDDPEAVGAGGIMTYTFRAVDAGEMTLRMVYIPPDGSEPTKSFEVTLIVD